MQWIWVLAALLGLGANAGEGRAPVTAAQLVAIEALLPAAQRSTALSSGEAAACVRTCRATAKQEYGVCKNAYPDNRDLCRIVREQRFADCPSVCGAAQPAPVGERG